MLQFTHLEQLQTQFLLNLSLSDHDIADPTTKMPQFEEKKAET
jgi:hypothetical protein